MIGYQAPTALQGMMMGMWMLASGIGGTLSSYSSNWMTAGQDSISPLMTNAGYSHVFLILALFAMASSVVLFALTPKLKALISENKPDASKETNVVINERVAVFE